MLDRSTTCLSDRTCDSRLPNEFEAFEGHGGHVRASRQMEQARGGDEVPPEAHDVPQAIVQV